jgi:hypothetical protein
LEEFAGVGSKLLYKIEVSFVFVLGEKKIRWDPKRRRE